LNDLSKLVKLFKGAYILLLLKLFWDDLDSRN
jgi:hypothetical protein